MPISNSNKQWILKKIHEFTPFIICFTTGIFFCMLFGGTPILWISFLPIGLVLGAELVKYNDRREKKPKKPISHTFVKPEQPCFHENVLNSFTKEPFYEYPFDCKNKTFKY